FVLDATAAVVVLAAAADEALQAVAGLRSVAFADIAGYVLGGGDETNTAVTLDELDALIESGVTVVDVREKDEPDDGTLVTICGSGPRAAIGASILRARGYDARPVLGGGMDDWLARGATTVS